MKTINKPWGKEIWLELNDKYCYKRIYINKGYKTSYQYHNEKLETNYIISGKAEVWLENDQGVVEKSIMSGGDFFTVKPPKKHRVIAITDIILQEVSTPEVDDVVRIEDDTHRGDGRLDREHMNPAMCILAAGIGSRLGKLTEHTNKGLVPINNKAAISHIIDKTPENYDIVIALGYKSNLVKEYCQAAHPNRKFIFVEVDDYESSKTGPGYTINFCKKYLQRPFMISTVDCLIEEDLPNLDGNWLGVCPTGLPQLYSTVAVDDTGKVKSFKNKSKNGHEYAFIGLCSILDYTTFWNKMQGSSEPSELVSAFYEPTSYKDLSVKKLNWYDIGTTDSYFRAKKDFETKDVYGIQKINGEYSYRVKDTFIKVFPNESSAANRIARAKSMSDFVPQIRFTGKNSFSYQWVQGSTLYDLDNPKLWFDFLEWCRKNMWTPVNKDISDLCDKFYKEKTYARFEKLLETRHKDYDTETNILGVRCSKMSDYLEKVDWEYLQNGIATQKFHGDLQFDNIIYDGNEFSLIDWRDTFAGSTTHGDVYYDLAKLYGGILMSYKSVKDENNYSFSSAGRNVSYTVVSTDSLEKFESVFVDWAVSNGFDFNKIKLLTALIYLNMSPLHEKNLGDILFSKSRLMLEQIFNDK